MCCIVMHYHHQRPWQKMTHGNCTKLLSLPSPSSNALVFVVVFVVAIFSSFCVDI